MKKITQIKIANNPTTAIAYDLSNVKLYVDGVPFSEIGNFDESPQYLELQDLRQKGFFQYGQVTDLYSDESPALFHEQLVVPPLHFYWLKA